MLAAAKDFGATDNETHVTTHFVDSRAALLEYMDDYEAIMACVSSLPSIQILEKMSQKKTFLIVRDDSLTDEALEQALDSFSLESINFTTKNVLNSFMILGNLTKDREMEGKVIWVGNLPTYEDSNDSAMSGLLLSSDKIINSFTSQLQNICGRSYTFA